MARGLSHLSCCSCCSYGAHTATRPCLVQTTQLPKAGLSCPRQPLPASCPAQLSRPGRTQSRDTPCSPGRAVPRKHEGSEQGLPPVQAETEGSFSLLTEGREQKQVNVLNSGQKSKKKYSLATLQRKLGVQTGPCNAQGSPCKQALQLFPEPAGQTCCTSFG